MSIFCEHDPGAFRISQLGTGREERIKNMVTMLKSGYFQFYINTCMNKYVLILRPKTINETDLYWRGNHGKCVFHTPQGCAIQEHKPWGCVQLGRGVDLKMEAMTDYWKQKQIELIKPVLEKLGEPEQELYKEPSLSEYIKFNDFRPSYASLDHLTTTTTGWRY